mmetsp:Transcript_123570/g.357351  ORF Transcript_123570/g.357351 Transcript_123570/m.357351 type:complete len:285 (-) Transcript_123570:98-952(-)
MSRIFCGATKWIPTRPISCGTLIRRSSGLSSAAATFGVRGIPRRRCSRAFGMRRLRQRPCFRAWACPRLRAACRRRPSASLASHRWVSRRLPAVSLLRQVMAIPAAAMGTRLRPLEATPATGSRRRAMAATQVVRGMPVASRAILEEHMRPATLPRLQAVLVTRAGRVEGVGGVAVRATAATATHRAQARAAAVAAEGAEAAAAGSRRRGVDERLRRRPPLLRCGFPRVHRVCGRGSAVSRARRRRHWPFPPPRPCGPLGPCGASGASGWRWQRVHGTTWRAVG